MKRQSTPETTRATIDLAAGDGSQPAAVGVTAVLDSMVRNTEAREQTFAKALQDQVARADQQTQVKGSSAAGPAPDGSGPAASGPAASVPTGSVSAGPAPSGPAAAAPASTLPNPSVPAATVPAATGLDAAVGRPSRFAPATRLPDARIDVAFTTLESLGRPRWNHQALQALEMPDTLLEATAGLDPSADVKWIEAVVRVAGPVCANVVDRPTLLVSCGHTDLADVLGLPVQRPGDLPPYGGTIYCVVGGDQNSADLEWMSRVQGDRALHVVLADDVSAAMLGDDVAAVSYATEYGAALALKVALERDIGLVFGVTQEGTPMRATPFDVALAIRSWMRGR